MLGVGLQRLLQFLPGMFAPRQGFQRTRAQCLWWRRQFGVLLHFQNLGQRLFGHVGADPVLDFIGHLRVFLWVFPGVVLALADAFLALPVPGAAFPPGSLGSAPAADFHFA
mgnify:CR=1 FL=1